MLIHQLQEISVQLKWSVIDFFFTGKRTHLRANIDRKKEKWDEKKLRKERIQEGRKKDIRKKERYKWNNLIFKNDSGKERDIKGKKVEERGLSNHWSV